MCRLYALSASHPTRVRCELVVAQNSLIRQAEQDARGLSNPHGWGIGYHTPSGPQHERQVDPAATDEDFREHAAEVDARVAIAHIRRATVGAPETVNTHPFIFGDAMLAHNGHIPRFDVIGAQMLEAMSDRHRNAVQGSTDSEHFFHLLLTNQEDHPERPMAETLAATIRQVLGWCEEVGVEEEPALNILWTDGDRLAGSRYGRTLYWVATKGVQTCHICGRTHAPAAAGDSYQSVEFASERITNEDWIAVPEETVFEVGDDCGVEFSSIGK